LPVGDLHGEAEDTSLAVAVLGPESRALGPSITAEVRELENVRRERRYED
jgi:hypothetical protein